MTSSQVPVEEGLFTWPSADPRLLGSRCTECNNHMFPVQSGCPKCSESSTEIVELDNEGTLWTWTIQGYPPKAPPYMGNVDPKTFEPFGVGYVELGGKVRVETRLTLNDPDELKIGMDLELVLVPLYTNDAGAEVLTFAFGPKGA